MEQILEVIARAQEALNAIKTDVETAQEKGVFSYARSKEIRKAAHQLMKDGKSIREIALETFKKQSE